MTAQAISEPHYRRTKSGEWVVQGPINLIREGATVDVHKRDGSVCTVTIASVGKAFNDCGIESCYGYLDPDRSRPQNTGTSRAQANHASPGGATDRQLQAIRKMLPRLERINQFDSFSGTGTDAAIDIEREMSQGLTRRDASNLMDQIAELIDDEM